MRKTNIRRLNRKLHRKIDPSIKAENTDGCTVLSGRLDDWDKIVEAGLMSAKPNSKCHVVNNIEFTGAGQEPMRMPTLHDSALEGRRPDVLIIGGGISGASIARELSRYKLDVLLTEKECDLAMGASGRNDGEVHPGIDLGRGSVKHSYIRRGNRMYEDYCRELDVPFKRVGQYVCIKRLALAPPAALYCLKRRIIDGIEDTRIISGKKLRELEPKLDPKFRFAISNPSTGTVSPYQLTIACAENAVNNGAQVSLNTAVTGMKVTEGKITEVYTNRGTIIPGLVINAAGVFADTVADMAGDRFFSIHPRRGTNAILDKKTGAYLSAVASIKGGMQAHTGHSKGGGIVHTAHDNLLVGPDAVETWQRENTATEKASIERVFFKQKQTMPGLSEKDIITYFAGIRAATYEEDFIIEAGRKTGNIIHVAGIQSPGLTTAPAVAQDVAALAVKMLGGAEKKDSFDPKRKAPPVLSRLSEAERGELIAKNSDYGVIVCRCEEVSKGEIIDALSSPICVPTVDGIKKRVRPGMGRCQGGFCSPQVVQIISEYMNIPPENVKKSSDGAYITEISRKGVRS